MVEVRIGSRIKERRLAKGYTQEVVAEKLGINRVSYAMYESIKKPNIPPSDKLGMLSDILNTSADYLLLRTNDPSPLPRQSYLDMNSGQTHLLTAEETAEYLAEEEFYSKVNVLKKTIEYIGNSNDIDAFEKRQFQSVIYESMELMKTKSNHIPLVGTICAGDGLLASENIEDHVVYPIIDSKRKPDFALRVKGDSMIGSGIDDGDIVFLKQASWADYNGQIVAAIINGDEGTLKKMKWTEGSPKVQLIPNNENYNVIEIFPNEVYICGVYMGHYKPEKTI